MTRQVLARALCLTLCCGVVPAVRATPEDTWRDVARHDALFAKGLADEQVRFASDFKKMIEGRVEACRKIVAATADLDATTSGHIDLFCEHYCMPWLQAWGAALQPCEHEPVPSWCDDRGELDRHIGFPPYFEAMTAALREAPTELERYNIMAVVASRLTNNLVRDYPHRKIDAGVGLVLAQFMSTASAEDILAIGRLLWSSASFGKRSVVAKQLRTYATQSTAITDAQRQQLQEYARSVAERPE